MTIHVPPPKELVGVTGRTMLLFDLAAGPTEFHAVDEILNSEFPDERTEGVSDEDSKYAEFRVSIVPYAFELVNRDAVKRKLWAQGVISIDPERTAVMPPAIISPPSGEWFDVIDALCLGSTIHHGKNINVAVLDTGIDRGHPDFHGRNILPEGIGTLLFDDYDDHGHGTHCVGIACGPRVLPDGSPGYGIADQSNILAGRIYSANTSPTEGQVLKGFRWARRHCAHIVTLSLNWRLLTPEPSPQLERAGRIMLDKGILVIASGAAGPGEVTPPANCNSIMAIGSVGRNGALSSFSPAMMGGRDPVDAVAYGENLLSSYIGSGHAILSGNSMAAALAGGIAALWAGKNGTYRGATLWEMMIDGADTTTSLIDPTFRTVGAGLLRPPP
jgi:subtilisin family serine protease